MCTWPSTLVNIDSSKAMASWSGRALASRVAGGPQGTLSRRSQHEPGPPAFPRLCCCRAQLSSSSALVSCGSRSSGQRGACFSSKGTRRGSTASAAPGGEAARARTPALGGAIPRAHLDLGLAAAPSQALFFLGSTREGGGLRDPRPPLEGALGRALAPRARGGAERLPRERRSAWAGAGLAGCNAMAVARGSGEQHREEPTNRNAELGTER